MKYVIKNNQTEMFITPDRTWSPNLWDAKLFSTYRRAELQIPKWFDKSYDLLIVEVDLVEGGSVKYESI